MEPSTVYLDPAASRGRSCRLVIPPQPRYGAFARKRIVDFARGHAVPETDIGDLLCALGEALANAFEHSHTRAKIEVACWLVGDAQIVATVVDTGIGIRATAEVGADAPLPEPTAERGRGFAIMRSCTDDVTVRSIPGKGTAVVLVRRVGRGSGDRRWHDEMTG